MNPLRLCFLALSALLAGTFPVAAQNLLLNGDFSAGNTNFSTDYGYVASGTSATPSTYGIRANSQDFNPAYSLFFDHTTGAGNMLLLDGFPAADKIAWSETVPAQPETSYTFSGWAASSDAASPSVLRFTINGAQVGSDLVLSNDAGVWRTFTATWNSGASTAAVIAIIDENLVSFGNDFALDDLSFAADSSTNRPTVLRIYPAVELGWNSDTGKVYQVQYSTILNSNAWVNLGPPTPGNGATSYLFDSTRDQPSKFYRVLTVP